jgi:hypothetical protein
MRQASLPRVFSASPRAFAAGTKADSRTIRLPSLCGASQNR